LYNFKKEEHKNAQGEEFLLMWGASVCCNPLGPPANLQTTGMVGHDSRVCTAWTVKGYCSDKGWIQCVELKTDICMNLHFKSQEETLTG